MHYVDTHCHLNLILKKMGNLSIEDLLAQIDRDQINEILTISAEPSDLDWVLETAQKYHQVYGALGVHPHDAKNCKTEHIDFVKKNCLDSKIVAIGEIGLDYHYLYSSKEEQKKVFISFLELATVLNMPVVIHSRDAEEDTIEILNDFSGKLSGVVHCFTGSLDFSRKLLDLHPGLFLGFTGVITFKNAEDLREVVKQTDLDRIMIETDSPFMAPIPHRGKICIPSYVREVAKQIGIIKNLSIEEVVRVTTQNSNLFFNKEKIAYVK